MEIFSEVDNRINFSAILSKHKSLTKFKFLESGKNLKTICLSNPVLLSKNEPFSKSIEFFKESKLFNLKWNVI